MFIAGNVLEGIATILDTVLWLYMWVIIIRALVSWVNPDPWNPIVQFLQRATDPVLYQIRKRLGMGSMGFDFSPIIAILLIMFLQIAVVGSLKDLAIRMHWGVPRKGIVMKITPLDIQHKVLDTQWRGYHKTQVDQFLEEIAE